jgi:hypothetical protein
MTMEFDKTMAVTAVCTTLGFAVLVAGISFTTRNGNEHFYRTAQACIDKGGIWIPHHYGTCIVR